MRYRERKKAGRRIAVAVVAIIALLSCGVLIALDVRKVAAEKKFEPRSAKAKATTKALLTFPPREESDKN
jgi:hypothetical protein